MEVFGRRGYRQGSLKDVADAVGLTVQGVLHHFPTKQRLLMATLDHRTALRSAKMTAIREADGVVALMRYLLADNLAHPGLMRLIVTVSAEATDPDHPAHDYFVRRYRVVHDDLRSAFVAEQAQGGGPGWTRTLPRASWSPLPTACSCKRCFDRNSTCSPSTTG